MAISLNNVTVARSISSGTANTVPSTTGNLIVVGMNVGGGPITSVTDSKGNQYVSVGQVPTSITGAGRCLDIWYAKAATTGVTTITVNYTGSAGSGAFAFYDCSGADATNPLSQYTPTLIAQPAAVNAIGASLMVGDTGGILIGVNSNNCSAINSPFTLDNATHEGLAHGLYSSSGLYTPNWTQTGSNDWVNLTAAFKSAPGVPLLLLQSAFQFTVAATQNITVLSTKLNSLIVVAVGYTSGTTPLVTDNAAGGTNQYLLCSNSTSLGGGSQNDSIAIYYSDASKAGVTSITTAATGSGSISGVVWELSGADLADTFDVAGHVDSTTGGTSGPPYHLPSATLSTSYAAEFIAYMSVATIGNVQTPFIPDPFVTQGESSGFTPGFRIVYGTGSYNIYTLDNTSGDTYNSSIASFNAIIAGLQGSAQVIAADYQWGGGSGF